MCYNTDSMIVIPGYTGLLRRGDIVSHALKRKIERLKKQIMDLGPLHPGRISRQYNVCGTPGCRCKDPDHPRKHGPYHYLSYTFAGKGKTVFVPEDRLAEMQRRTQAHARLKELVAQWVQASIELAREEALRRARDK